MIWVLRHISTKRLFGAEADNSSRNAFYYIPISDTPSELHVFWPTDTECLIKLTFSEFVSLSLIIRLMTLLMMTLLMIKLINMLQEMSNVPT